MTASAVGSATNWAGNVVFGARRYSRPSSVEELQRIVAAAPRVKAAGTGHSFNTIADTDGEQVSLLGLPPTVDVDGDRRRVRVAGGVRYGELTRLLHTHGLAVHNLGSLPHISVAGACATGTHGSGVRNGILATAVRALDVVTPSGELVHLSREADGDRFAGHVVALGTLGFVTALELDVGPAFEVEQTVWDGLPHENLVGALDEVLAAAYSVSVFTRWQDPPVHQVWVKRRGGDPWTADLAALGARPADGPRHPVPGMPVENCTQQLGVPGPWHERLPHFRLEFTPSSGEELQSEYLVPRELGAEAVEAVAAVRGIVGPVVQISEIRAVAADDLWLSPASGRDSVALHFTWISDARAVAPAVAAVEEALAPFEARPHWGKVFTTPPGVVRSLYPRFADMLALVAETDPEGKLRNAWTDRVLGTS